jgi:glycerophosphoryl diester phosphodiesterase
MNGAASRWRRQGDFPGGAAKPGRPLIIAHRGASAACTENTAAAFARAAQDGADGVELDVLTCASGEVVVFHDDDLQRLAGRPERVAGLSLRQLRRIGLPGKTSIPTLEEAFEACGPELLVNVELKSGGLLDGAVSGLVAGVARVVDRCAAGARALISSFDPRAVWLWQQARPDLPAALLVERGQGASLVAACKALCLPLLRPLAVHPEVVLCRGDLVAACQRAGYLVNCWTVDDPSRLRQLRDMNIDGIICNDPAAARTALARSS